jgi:hypothetical protein
MMNSTIVLARSSTALVQIRMIGLCCVDILNLFCSLVAAAGKDDGDMKHHQAQQRMPAGGGGNVPVNQVCVLFILWLYFWGMALL